MRPVVADHVEACTTTITVAARVSFRVTRNSDLTIQETEVKSSLLSTIQENLRQRKWGAAVRLEISDKADEGFLSLLRTTSALDLEVRDVYKVPGPVDLGAGRRGLCYALPPTPWLVQVEGMVGGRKVLQTQQRNLRPMTLPTDLCMSAYNPKSALIANDDETN